MAFLDFIKDDQTSVQNLPENVKSQAVEAARPAAEGMGRAAQTPEAPSNATAPSASPAQGRSLGWER
jgi:hypothetical protein